MAGKRKASDDAPGSPRPPPPRRRRGAGNEDGDSSLGDNRGDSRSDSEDPIIDDEAAREAVRRLLGLQDRQCSYAPGEWWPTNWEELVAEEDAQAHSPPPDDQHADAEVQQQPLADQASAEEVADQSTAEELADQSVAAAAPAPEMVAPAADSALCSGCEREPASVRLVPVEHACLCPPCRSNPSGRPRCLFCDAPRR